MNYDMTFWEISLTIGAELFSSVGEFTNVQGYRNWFYLQYFHSNDSYTELNYDSVTTSYTVSEITQCYIQNLTHSSNRALYPVDGL